MTAGRLAEIRAYAMLHPPWPPAEDIEDEWRLVRDRREAEALAAGLTAAEAAIFAVNGVDVGQLRRLVDDGCAPMLIARIVL